MMDRLAQQVRLGAQSILEQLEKSNSASPREVLPSRLLESVLKQIKYIQMDMETPINLCRAGSDTGSV